MMLESEHQEIVAHFRAQAAKLKEMPLPNNLDDVFHIAMIAPWDRARQFKYVAYHAARLHKKYLDATIVQIPSAWGDL